jgi:hypothetical protein
VLDDVHRTTSLQPAVELEVDDDGFLRIRYRNPSGAGGGGGLTERADPSLLVEIADWIQEQVTEDVFTAWPVCPTHDMGLHALEEADRAVWWCAFGDHEVAPIGRLGLTGGTGLD